MNVKAMRETDALPTLSSEKAHDIRDQAVEELFSAVDCVVVGATTVMKVDEVPHYGTIHMAGDQAIGSAFARLTGRPLLPGAFGHQASIPRQVQPWSLSRPLDIHRDRMALFGEDHELSLTEVYQSTDLPIIADYYRPASVTDQLRALVYDGDEFVAWVACFKANRARFTQQDQREAQRKLPRIKALFRAAKAQEWPEAAAYALFDGSGQLESCSRLLAQGLSMDQLRALGAHACRLDAGDPSRSPYFVLGGLTASFVRLDAERGVRYLASLTRPAAYRIAPGYRLTPRQRALAQRFAFGDTTAQAARALGLTEETARSHLKSIYRRLGVSDRLRLRNLLSQDD